MQKNNPRVFTHCSTWTGIIIVGTALWLSGCSRQEQPPPATAQADVAKKPEIVPEPSAPVEGGYDQSLLRDQVTTYRKLADVYERVTNRKDLQNAMPAIQALEAKIKRLARTLSELPAERRQIGEGVLTQEVRELNVRYTMAKNKALGFK